MRTDERIRERLARAADPLGFAIERSLGRVTRVAPRRAGRRRAATIAFALGFAAFGVFVAWRTLPGDRDRGELVAPTGATGRLAYMALSEQDGSETLRAYWIDVASAMSSPLAGAGPAAFPVWSPDGSKVAYAVQRRDDDRFDVYVADPGGAGATRVSAAYEGTSGLAWSPDGAQVAFAGKAQGDLPEYGLIVVGADGANERLVVRGEWQSVSWSPDGERLLLTGYPPARSSETPEEEMAYEPVHELYTVRPDGSDLRTLSDDPLYEHWATWSPDGSRIVFVRSEEYDDVDYRSDVYVADADGSNARRLTTWEGFDSFPVWSPDGEWIAFASDRSSTPEQQRANRVERAFSAISIYVMRADGSDVRLVLTSRPDETLLPSSWAR